MNEEQSTRIERIEKLRELNRDAVRIHLESYWRQVYAAAQKSDNLYQALQQEIKQTDPDLQKLTQRLLETELNAEPLPLDPTDSDIETFLQAENFVHFANRLLVTDEDTRERYLQKLDQQKPTQGENNQPEGRSRFSKWVAWPGQSEGRPRFALWTLAFASASLVILIAILALLLFSVLPGIRQLASGSREPVAISTQPVDGGTDPGDDPEVATPTITPLPAEPQGHLVTMPSSSYWCEAGTEWRQPVVVINGGAEPASFTFDLPEGARFLAGSETHCESFSSATPANYQLESKEEKTFIISVPTVSGEQNDLSVHLHVEGETEPLDVAILSQPDTKIDVSLELEEASAPFVLTGEYVEVPFRLNVQVPGTYQIVCRGEDGTEGSGEPVQVTKEVTAGEVNQPVSAKCTVPISGTVPGTWQATVYPLNANGDQGTTTALNPEPATFDLEKPQIRLAISRDEYFGLRDTPNLRNVSLIVPYVITNSGNVTASISIALSIPQDESVDALYGVYTLSPGENQYVRSAGSPVDVEAGNAEPLDDPSQPIQLIEELPPCPTEENCPVLRVVVWVGTQTMGNLSETNAVEFELILQVEGDDSSDPTTYPERLTEAPEEVQRLDEALQRSLPGETTAN